jgi:hypothetical protein
VKGNNQLKEGFKMSESNGNGGVVYLGINVWWNFTASRVDMDEVGAVLMANGFDPEKYMARGGESCSVQFPESAYE